MGLQLFLRAREGSSRGDFYRPLSANRYCVVRDKKEGGRGGGGGEKTRFKKYLTL